MHSKICSFVSCGVPVDMKEFETIFENLRVIFAEYKQYNAIQAYSDGCFALIYVAIEMFDTKDSGIDDMVYRKNLQN